MTAKAPYAIMAIHLTKHTTGLPACLRASVPASTQHGRSWWDGTTQGRGYALPTRRSTT